MPLITCPDCRKELSSSAPVCPHCGRPTKRKANISPLTGCALVVFGLFIIGVLASQCDGKPATTASTEDSKAINLNAVITVGRYQLRIKNDDSFDWNDCDLTLNFKMFGTDYNLKHFLIPSQTTVPLALNDFASRGGERFNPLAQKVKSALLSCQTSSGKGVYGAEFRD